MTTATEKQLLHSAAQVNSSNAKSIHSFTQLLLSLPLSDVLTLAGKLRHRAHKNHFDLCSIVNVKSGHCSEDCRFCAQSVHYNTAAPVYPFLDQEEILSLARHNESKGVHRYSLVGSGKGINDGDLEKAEISVAALRENTSLSICTSFGIINTEKAKRLKTAGVSTYHHNLEAAKSFYPQICSTHSYKERVETLRIAKEAGLSLCSGGIIGLGESFDQRIELAAALRELGVLSIPINILDGIEGTPLAGTQTPPTDELLLSIAAFRILNPDAYIRLAGGRRHLGAEFRAALHAGVDAAIVGDFLTTLGSSIDEDLETIRVGGFIPVRGEF